ncbi:hypothetical protein [Roseateles sp. L2-2]|uniref:hypothetical protein n=1 Tax=Roseateles sp. L2-2 TaxID=3422597 RepID=UPI003D36A44D
MAQTTRTVSTLAEEGPVVPTPLTTLQVWLGDDGCFWTVTAYPASAETAAANVAGPLAATVRSSAALLRSTRPVPASPSTCAVTA